MIETTGNRLYAEVSTFLSSSASAKLHHKITTAPDGDNLFFFFSFFYGKYGAVLKDVNLHFSTSFLSTSINTT